MSQSQTTNTMELLPTLMGQEFRAEFQIEPGAELVRAMGGTCRLEAVASNFRALEGKRPTFTVGNEPHQWVKGNHGHDLAKVLRRNAAKMNARVMFITNAFQPGEDSYGERLRQTWEKVQEGRAVDSGTLYDSIEAHPKTPLTPEALRIVVPKIRGDSWWLDVEALIAEVLDVTNSPAESRRWYLNQVAADEDALLAPGQWDPLELPDALLRPGDPIVLGFDGGKTDDSTALVAIRTTDMCAFLLGIWEKPDNMSRDERWEVDQRAVDSAVHETFRVFDVKGFYADVAFWESWISEWADAYAEGLLVKAPGKTGVGFDMRSSQKLITMAHEQLLSSILEQKLRHNGDLTLRRHALNARRRDNVYGVSFGKESRESPRKVDAYAALLLAHEALMDLRAKGKPDRRGGSRVYFM